MATQISKQGVRFIARFEGFRSCPYQDSGGVWTIGYGETEGVGPRTPCVSETEAREALHRRLNHDYAPAIRKAVEGSLRQRDLDGLASFTYNNGIGAFQSSTLLARWNRGEDRCTVAKEELAKWVHAGGQVLSGLVKRRKAEAHLICTGEYQ